MLVRLLPLRTRRIFVALGLCLEAKNTKGQRPLNGSASINNLLEFLGMAVENGWLLE